MSLTKSATRRLSLLTGSSLVVASLTAAASFGVLLTPTTALAANECAPVNVDPTANDPGLVTRNPDSYVCSDNNYPNGITYTSHGDLTVSTNTSTTVMTTNAGGIDLDGLSSDSVTFTATRPISGTAGPVIDVTSVSGAINVSTTAAITANTGTASHAIQARSTGGGAVNVTTGAGAINANANAVTTGQSAIDARSTGGNGAVTVTTGTGTVTGRLWGVFAQSSGTGALTINTGGLVQTNTTATSGGIGQQAAIEARTGSGLLTINVNGDVNGTGGSAIRTVAGGNSIVTIATGRTVQAGVAGGSSFFSGEATPLDWVLDLSGASGTTTTINNNGGIKSDRLHTNNSNFNTATDKAIRVLGGTSVVINNTGRILGRVDFAGAGSSTFNITATGAFDGWHTMGDSVFSGGAHGINVGAGSGLYTNGFRTTASGTGVDRVTNFDFGAGDDVLNNAGRLVIGEGLNAPGITHLILTSLESFNNSGDILLGGPDRLSLAANTDRSANDVLTAQGVAFTGSGASRIAMDVNLAGAAQTSCAEMLERQTAGAPTSADCVDFSGGSTAGSTLITVRSVTPGNAFGGFQRDGIVLIDVSGGTSAAEHFILDPASDNYVELASGGGFLFGYFTYGLAYNEETQQHIIASIPNAELTEFTAYPQTVQGIWQTSTTSWFDRRAGGRGPDDGAGVWLRVTGEETKRDLIQSVTNANLAAAHDNSYEQKTNSLTGGIDLFVGDAGALTYSVGAMLGYVNGRLDFANSASATEYRGGTLGVYGSAGMGPFFVNAAINGLALVMDLHAPAVDLPSGLTTNSKVRSVGAQAEAGWRADLGPVFIEPLVSVAYVSTRFDQIDLGQARIDYDDPVSLRGGVGLRVGADLGWVNLDAVARYWNEFEGENSLIVDNDADDLPLVDDLSGQFTELGAGATFSVGGGLGVFLSAGGRFADGYEAAHGSLGVSYRW